MQLPLPYPDIVHLVVVWIVGCDCFLSMPGCVSPPSHLYVHELVFSLLHMLPLFFFSLSYSSHRSISSQQAREEEQKKFDEIREEIEKVRLSVKEETGMRVEAIKAMRAVRLSLKCH